jgi:TfoX/Sxy family transcriptional regulator of competence genes
MAYDHELAARIRAAVAGRAAVTEREMFGGICFMVGGNMLAGVLGDGLLVRVGADGHAAAAAEPHAGPFEMARGRAMKGFVVIAAPGCATPRAVASWLERAWAYVGRLPPKPKAAARKPARAGTKRAAPRRVRAVKAAAPRTQPGRGRRR